MKKLMILAAAVAIAALANASVVTWGSGAVYNPNNTTVKIGEQTGDWIMTVAFYSDADGKTAVTGLSGAFSDDSTAKASKFTGDVSGFDNGKTYYAQAIIVDKAGNWSIDSGIVSFTTQSTADSSIMFNDASSVSAAWDTQSIGTTGDVGKWVAAPEPTSGLLLLIGMAGLALKRKRA